MFCTFYGSSVSVLIQELFPAPLPAFLPGPGPWHSTSEDLGLVGFPGVLSGWLKARCVHPDAEALCVLTVDQLVHLGSFLVPILPLAGVLMWPSTQAICPGSALSPGAGGVRSALCCSPGVRQAQDAPEWGLSAILDYKWGN